MLLAFLLLEIIVVNSQPACKSKDLVALCEKCDQSCCALSNHDVLCCGLNSTFEFKEKSAVAVAHINNTGEGTNKDVHSLLLYKSRFEELDAKISTTFQLEELVVVDSQFPKISSSFNESVQCLNLSGNGLKSLPSGMLESLSALRVLDLARNNLTVMPNISKHVQNLTVDISGNDLIDCRSLKPLLDSEHNKTVTLENKNASFCSYNRSYQWFYSADKISLEHFEKAVETEEECSRIHPRNCRCWVVRVWFSIENILKPKIMIDCSNRNLTKLPSGLPDNTCCLNVSNNNITSLQELKDDISYRSLSEFYADNNQISSINELEGTSFISNFTVLSLRNNSLKSVPTYFLTDAFGRSVQSPQVHLGGNKFQCDCDTAQVFKAWLISNVKNIVDTGNIFCDNMDKKVVDLDQNEVCIITRSWMDYIYYIIAGEIALLILLVSKVSYDYWVFKTAGYLPWPASKMPKLPCDWVCET